MKLAAYLEKTGQSALAFAQKVDLSVHAIRKYVSGARRQPRPDNILKIKKITKGEVAEIDWYN